MHDHVLLVDRYVGHLADIGVNSFGCHRDTGLLYGVASQERQHRKEQKVTAGFFRVAWCFVLIVKLEGSDRLAMSDYIRISPRLEPGGYGQSDKP